MIFGIFHHIDFFSNQLRHIIQKFFLLVFFLNKHLICHIFMICIAYSLLVIVVNQQRIGDQIHLIVCQQINQAIHIVCCDNLQFQIF